MHARMSRIAGLPPERIDEARQYFEQAELPALQKQQGYQGVIVMVAAFLMRSPHKDEVPAPPPAIAS